MAYPSRGSVVVEAIDFDRHTNTALTHHYSLTHTGGITTSYYYLLMGLIDIIHCGRYLEQKRACIGHGLNDDDGDGGGT